MDYRAIEQKLKRAMKDQGTYTRAMDISISIAAGSYACYLKAREEVQSMPICSKRKSREGNEYKVVNPEFQIMLDMAEQTRKALRELRLTRATIESGSDDDEIDDLIREVDNAGKE